MSFIAAPIYAVNNSNQTLASAAPVGSEDDKVMSKLIPFSFDNIKDSVLTKVKGNMRMIDKALSHHDEPKDRAKELKVIASKLGLDLSRKSEEFLFLESVAITKVASRPEGLRLIFDLDSFLREFPEFSGLSLEEITKLNDYRNMMKIAIQVIPAKWNYNHLLALVARLAEGGKVKYVTGSGATDQVRFSF